MHTEKPFPHNFDTPSEAIDFFREQRSKNIQLEELSRLIIRVTLREDINEWLESDPEFEQLYNASLWYLEKDSPDKNDASMVINKLLEDM